jgi:23S rRNA (pseudouridine1915-N3)-methyltransferase
MRILIAAIGKLKDDAEREIIARYVKRCEAQGRALGLGPLEIIELPESRAANSEARKADEAQRLLKSAAAATYKIALDVEGRHMTSEAFAGLLGKQADVGTKVCALLIGGPDGHGPELLHTASLKLSLGAITLPHGLARVVLTEQLYRATTILSGHPYHRG